MTFTRLTLGDPRLRGRPKGPPVEEPCVDSPTEGTVFDSGGFENSSSDWPGVLWYRQNDITDFVGYRLLFGNWPNGFSYDESVQNTPTAQGQNSSNPVTATRDTPMIPGIVGVVGGVFGRMYLSQKHSASGGWALGTWVTSTETFLPGVTCYPRESCPDSIMTELGDGSYTGIAVPGQVVTTQFSGMVTDYGPRQFTNPGFEVTVLVTHSNGFDEAILSGLLPCAQDGSWRTLSYALAPNIAEPAHISVTVRVKYTKSGNNVYVSGTGPTDPLEEMWIDNLVVTIE